MTPELFPVLTRLQEAYVVHLEISSQFKFAKVNVCSAVGELVPKQEISILEDRELPVGRIVFHLELELCVQGKDQRMGVQRVKGLKKGSRLKNILLQRPK